MACIPVFIIIELSLPTSFTHLTHAHHYVTNYQQIGDMVTIEGSGAYCSGMSTKNYNSFPEVPEVILAVTGEAHVIRKWVDKPYCVLPLLLWFIAFSHDSLLLFLCYYEVLSLSLSDLFSNNYLPLQTPINRAHAGERGSIQVCEVDKKNVSLRISPPSTPSHCTALHCAALRSIGLLLYCLFIK